MLEKTEVPKIQAYEHFYLQLNANGKDGKQIMQ